jgi:hypothetical protein
MGAVHDPVGMLVEEVEEAPFAGHQEAKHDWNSGEAHRVGSRIAALQAGHRAGGIAHGKQIKRSRNQPERFRGGPCVQTPCAARLSRSR